MKLARLLLLFALWCLQGCSETVDVEDPLVQSSRDITFGQIETIESQALNESRELWIRLPESAMLPDSRNTAYPVLILLDGEANYYSIAGMIRQLSEVNGNLISPEMIVVGIPNTDRYRDLSPTHTEGNTGGGDAFLDFIEFEVLPYLEEHYPASTYRTFIGHSLGGLTVIHTLNSRSHLFENYVAIDPSLWWDDRAVLRESEVVLANQDFEGKSLFLSIANTMPPNVTMEDVETDSSETTDHIRALLRYSQLANENASNGLNFSWKYYDDNTHANVAIISEYDALKFLFSWYNPKEINHFFMDESEATVEEVVNYATSHFDDISDRFGFRYHPPESWINMLGRSMTSRGRPEGTLAMFSLNIQNFPNSRASHYWLGDYYASQNDTDNAKLHFLHAVEIGDAPQSAFRLASLDSAQE